MRIGRFLTVNEVKNYIMDYHAPALCIIAGEQSIPNDVMTKVNFDTELYDLYDMWDISNPDDIYTTSDGIWTILARISWASNPNGYRVAQLGGVVFPAICNQIVAANVLFQENGLVLMTHIDASAPIQLILIQNSGGALNISWAQLIMLKHVDYPYPLEIV